MRVFTKGKIENPALLFLHAFPMTGDMWKEQINFFSEDFYCVVPDLPGFGGSILPDSAVTFEYYVDSVLSYLKEAKIEKAVWCGLSMGGYLALRMYEKASDQCRALILCDTKSGADSNEAKLKRWAAIQSLQKNRTEFVEAQWQALIGDTSKKSFELKDRFEELVAEVVDRGIASGLVALATRTDTTQSLSQIRVPTLILVGREDKVTPITESEVMAKAITGSQLKIMNQVGHLSNLENPIEFNDHISEFLISLE